MLQDLISAQLISDYIIVELSGSINDLQGTKRVRTVDWNMKTYSIGLSLTLITNALEGMIVTFSVA